MINVIYVKYVSQAWQVYKMQTGDVYMHTWGKAVICLLAYAYMQYHVEPN